MRTGAAFLLMTILTSIAGAQHLHLQNRAMQKLSEQKPPEQQSKAEQDFELNTLLMKITFKIIGKDSIGTAFILGKPDPKSPNRAYYVLITAAHVLEQMSSDDAELILRKKNGDTYIKGTWRIKIRKDGKPLWHRHLSVDVAAMYVNIPNQADLPLLSLTFLATDEFLNQLELHPGDNLFCLGFPYGFEANEYGFPILRSGRVASYPLLPTNKVKTFLYDFNVFAGNSGGPVYISESTRAKTGTALGIGDYRAIIGLVSEQIYVKDENELTTSTKQQRASLGLAVVIHASFIRETIDGLPLPP